MIKMENMMKVKILLVMLGMFLIAGCIRTESQDKKMTSNPKVEKGMQVATFAGGCYWCMDASFEKLSGLKDVISGHAIGMIKGSKETVPVEAIQVIFDPKNTSYSELLEYYWKQFDPTDSGGSFYDRGPEYESYIFYHNGTQKSLAEKSKENLAKSGIFNKPIVTKVINFVSFKPVAESEQHFYKKNPERYYSYRKASGRDEFIKSIWGDLSKHRYSKLSETDLKKDLTPLQYNVTQKGATETPFENTYWDNHKAGIYVDIASGEPLFSSLDKFESGTGWPSFTKPIDPRFIHKIVDGSFGMERVEVKSRIAGSHLGHVFDDGPAPTHLRYCLDSAALRFIPKDDLAKEGYGYLAWIFK